jgi:CheY-like chemotaxis protein
MKTKHHIVVVDDDSDDREIIRDAFNHTSEGHDISLLENGDQLMEFLEKQDSQHLPSLILLDLNMPGKDGRETLRDLKADPRFRQIPTIVFTTSSSGRDRKIVYEMGANCFITKPDTFNNLVETTKCIANLWLL